MLYLPSRTKRRRWKAVDSVKINKTLEMAEQVLREDKSLSPSIHAVFGLLLEIVKMLLLRFNLNSSNSSKPPSTDGNRLKPTRTKSGKKPGGQKGHLGKTLEPVTNPDVVEILTVDLSTLPVSTYETVGYKKRQVFDIEFKRVVTEYQAEIVRDENGHEFMAPFPDHVTRHVQYGASVKEHVVYLSAYQFIPVERLITQFHDQYKMALSCGSVFNFISDAASRLELFKQIAQAQLKQSTVMNVDETGININKKLHWLHGASNSQWTWLEPHPKRGTEAIDAIGIVPDFKGVLVHDHLKAYFTYTECSHSLCNAHHFRELTWSFEEDKQAWAGEMKTYLEELNDAVNTAGGVLTAEEIKPWIARYQTILEKGNSECPAPKPPDPMPGEKQKRGQVKKSKSRNLLERLRDYQTETLRFAVEKDVPFTNNLGERILRMEKVKQKISGCFKSLDTAKEHAIIRSYLITCEQNDVSSSDALKLLFQGKWPEFISQKLLES